MIPATNTLNNNWQSHGLIAPGGTILGIAAGPAGIWLATEAGIWRGEAGAWQPIEDAAPLPRTVALACAEHALVAGGAPGGIVYSVDGGRGWRAAWVDEIDSLVTCFAVSPRFAHDGVLLAGTAGAGLLRSTDGGRRWWLANFGLHEFDVLALATTPDWDERELAFAATIGGVYRSPNGGRAWKRIAELDGAPIQALAISSRFAENRTVYAAGEEAALFCSTDAGRTWQALALAGDGPTAFNCLWVAPDDPALLVAGTPDGEIYRSTNAGRSWGRVAQGLNPVLALASDAEIVYAGLYEDGLLLSRDRGATWQLDSSLAARDITRLVITGAATAPLRAYGPTGGVWRAADTGSAEGTGWQRLDDFASDGVVTSVVSVGPGRLLASTEAGLFRSDDGGEHWELALPPNAEQIAVLAGGSAPGEAWAGDAGGGLWRSTDGGRLWAPVATIAAGLPLVALAHAGASRLVAATYDAALGRAAIWRSDDAGHSWAHWLEQPASWPRVSICPAEEPRTYERSSERPDQEPGEGLLIAVGAHVWRWQAGWWQSAEVDGRPLAALLRLPGTAGFVTATASGAYHSADGAAWAPLGDTAPRGLVDLALAGDGRLLALARGGTLWSLDLNERA